MNTQQLVTLLKNDFAAGYSRTTILEYIKRAQNEMFNSDCAQMLFLNKSDKSFPVPILSTTDEVLKYIPSASNLVDSEGNAIALTVNGYTVSVRRIVRIFIEDSATTITSNNKFYGREFEWSGINRNYYRNTNTVSYSEMPISVYDKTNVEDAHLVFVENPGTHTDKYYIEFYYGPVSLDSESSLLSVDGDKWTEAFIKAIRGYIEESRNGRSECLDGPANTGSFRRYWLPRFRNSANAGVEMKRPYVFDTRHCL